MSTLEVNSLQHLDASANNLDLDSSGNATVNGNMTATEFYGGGGNLTGVGVDGIVSTANATAITIDSSENVGLGVTPEGWYSSFVTLQIGNAGAISGRSNSNHMTVSANIATNTAGTDEYINTDYASHYQQYDGKHVFKVAPSGTADAAISWTTGLEVLNSGKARAPNGILFGSDSAIVNTLDDYEEGSWTPAVTSTGGSFTAGSTGRYTKIGRVVHLFGIVASSSSFTYANSTDLWTITGVPFAEAGQGYTGQPGSFYGKLNWNNSGSASTTNSIVTPTVSDTYINLNVCNSADVDGGNARIKCANNSSFIVQINVTYYTNV
jgi:hypothetical protein